MKAKIAITGLPKTNKTLLAAALSNMTDIPLIGNKTMYEWYRLFGFSDSKPLEWKDMFLVAVASFCERAKNEMLFDCFISDGASFSELMWLKTNFDLEKNQNDMVESLEILCASYAARRYDFIIHTGNDDLYVQFYQRYQIPYKMYNSVFPEQSLKKISKDIHVPLKNSVESSIYQAKSTLFIK